MTCQRRYPGCAHCGCDPSNKLYECQGYEGLLDGHVWEPTQWVGGVVTDPLNGRSAEYTDFKVPEAETCSMPDCETYDENGCTKCRTSDSYQVLDDGALYP